MSFHKRFYRSPSGERYESIESYRDLLMRNLFVFSGSRPLSSLVRQSTELEIMFQRQSVSAMWPRWIGEAAVRANIIGHIGASWSYSVRASLILQAWKVSCRQHWPIPNPIASIYIWSGNAFFPFSPSSPNAVKSSLKGLEVFTSLKTVRKIVVTLSKL